jgi:hypothetical protein
MADWNTRLAVTVGTETITPIESFTPTLTTAYRVQHSLEKDNVGFVRQPFTFTFAMTVRAIGTSGAANGVAKLTKMALEGTEFEITVQRADDSPGDQWAFQEVLFKRCFVTSAAPSNLTLQDSPTATFNGICLQYEITDQAGQVTKNTGQTG